MISSADTFSNEEKSFEIFEKLENYDHKQEKQEKISSFGVRSNSQPENQIYKYQKLR